MVVKIPIDPKECIEQGKPYAKTKARQMLMAALAARLFRYKSGLTDISLANIPQPCLAADVEYRDPFIP